MGINPSLPPPKGPPIPRPRPERPPRPEDLPNAALTDERFKSVQQRITGPKPDLPPPFTDERFKGALLAGKRRQLEGHLDPISAQTDADALNFSPELQGTSARGEAWDAKRINARYFDTLRGLADGSIRPNNLEERVYRDFFGRNPNLLKEQEGILKDFATFDERRGNVPPDKIAKATAGFFERSFDWVTGNHKINREERDELIEGMTKDYLAMMVKTHEMRHLTFNKDKYRKFLLEQGFYPHDPENVGKRKRWLTNLSREEELNRAMDWFYAPEVMKEKVLEQQVGDGVLRRYKSDRQTPEFLKKIYKLFFTSIIRRVERL